MYTKILIPLNPYLSSEKALSLVHFLFPNEEPELILLESTSNAISTYPPYTGDTMRFDQAHAFAKRSSPLDHIYSAIDATSQLAPKVRGFSVFGKSEEAIAKVAKSENVDLVLIFKDGNEGLLQNSVLDEVIRAVPCPVLVIRGQSRPESFLIILDGTQHSERILSPVFELARLFEADVTLGHSKAVDLDLASQRPVSELYLDDVIRRYRNFANDLEIFVEHGAYSGDAAGPLISKPVRKYGYDLIATAANNWSAVVPILAEGEAANGVIHQSDPALLIAKPKEEAC
ncbi:MAG: universal stress protein [Anaerolineae bacterium]